VVENQSSGASLKRVFRRTASASEFFKSHLDFWNNRCFNSNSEGGFDENYPGMAQGTALSFTTGLQTAAFEASKADPSFYRRGSAHHNSFDDLYFPAFKRELEWSLN
jgi:hypothetical protein